MSLILYEWKIYFSLCSFIKWNLNETNNFKNLKIFQIYSIISEIELKFYFQDIKYYNNVNCVHLLKVIKKFFVGRVNKK